MLKTIVLHNIIAMFKTIVLIFTIYLNTAHSMFMVVKLLNLCSFNVPDVQNNHCDILEPDTPA